jgi:hypothetical protein
MRLLPRRLARTAAAAALAIAGLTAAAVPVIAAGQAVPAVADTWTGHHASQPALADTWTGTNQPAPAGVTWG